MLFGLILNLSAPGYKRPDFARELKNEKVTS